MQLQIHKKRLELSDSYARQKNYLFVKSKVLKRKHSRILLIKNIRLVTLQKTWASVNELDSFLSPESVLPNYK